MNLFIPSIGNMITLTQDWEFNIEEEYRNAKFLQSVFPNQKIDGWAYPPKTFKFCFKAGSVLKIDRIYIRKGKAEYDSITFTLQHDSSGEIKKKPRFWVKLTDANTIVCDPGDSREK